ncbi:nucleotidyltransferase [Photobacterium damselae subsp. damselae]|uniref:SMODS domain-containing nucleotidyltransferase n=1 Tax=Photobacterium damselae TaxID=38293 RepID=UPI000D05418A|nr:nucleotidyltransferase [Photobacterium damselae]PSB84361.1 nucleotidyltransferase [Photobacterium damselae subsp. damselae]
MPRTIEEGFRDFAGKLTPTATETNLVKSHRASIETTLKKNFQMTNFFRSGSFGNGTSISGYSDVDYFAVIPTNNLKENSSNSLCDIKDILATRFSNTRVRVSSPTVLVPFGSLKSESTEIVVADNVDIIKGYDVYEIADGKGGWIRSSPKAHNDYVRTVDKKHGGKVKKLIRFIKAWKYYNSVPISSFYLELQVTKFCNEEPSIIYLMDLKSILNKLLSNNLASLRDPVGISGLIAPCSSDSNYKDALSKLKTAVNRATKAYMAESENNTKDAFYWLNMLYNNRFTNYNY